MTVARYGVAAGTEDARHPSIENMIEIAVEAFRAVGDDRAKSRRMADAATTCALEVTGLDGTAGITALLDRDPIEVVERPLPDAVSRIYGPAEAWLPVFRKGNLGIALARGELAFEGPVREFLRVFPIFRSTYRDVVLGRRGPLAADGGARA